MATFGSVSGALELLVHSYDDVPGDWPDVLTRSESLPLEIGRSTRRAHRRLAVAFAFVLIAAAIVAAAFATGFAGRFSSWVSGSPGAPASSAEQQAFKRRNAAAYVSFPQGTKLRLLLSQSVDGKRFDLLGFQNGDAYCLRLIRADLPGGIGENTCLRAAELNGTAAVVAGNAAFQIGKPAKNITGVYGFVADNVNSIKVNRLISATTSAQLGSNVFLALRARPAGSVQHHPAQDPVTTVVADMKGGGSKQIPYVSQGQGVFRTAHVTVPSYFGPATITSLPGPTKIAYRASSNIGWLTNRQSVGQPFPSKTRISQQGMIEFGRVIKPDPASPDRVGILLFTPTRRLGQPLSPQNGKTMRCLVTFPVLSSSQPGSMSCYPLTGAQEPLTPGGYLESAVTDFAGLASDAVASVSLYLSDGREINAALTDNVYSVAVPAAELPGKLVAFDKQHRVIDIHRVGFAAATQPCPAAVFTRPASSFPAAQPWEKIDLATLNVNGKPILGQTVSKVEAALGKPTGVMHASQIENGVAIPALLYGGTTTGTAGLIVAFIKKGSEVVANNLNYSSPSVTDTRLGKLLRLQPTELQTKLKATYGASYRLALSYGSNPRVGCTGTFVSATGPRGFTFELNTYRPSRPILLIEANAAAGR